MGAAIEIFWVMFIFAFIFMGTVQPAPKERTSYFEADEHDLIGSRADLHEPGMNTKLTLPNEIELKFGQIVALGGDFYGVSGSPIIDINADDSGSEENQRRRQRFLAAYGTLATKQFDANETSELNRLVTMFNEDKAVRASGEGELHSHTEYGAASPNMLSLAIKNYDHFQPQAKQAYLVGHQLAMEKARAAARETNAENKKEKLMEAYSLDAFAGHYLTDCFSSGHIRTPRVQLYKQLWIPLNGDYLSKYMHDEDSKFGLRVKSNKNKRWIAYGDGYLLKNGSKDNLQKVVEAVQKSVDQVHEAYQHPDREINTDDVTDLLPFVDPDAENNTPLFQMKDGELHMRSDTDDLQSNGTTSDWTGAGAVLSLVSHDPENSAIPSA